MSASPFDIHLESSSMTKTKSGHSVPGIWFCLAYENSLSNAASNLQGWSNALSPIKPGGSCTDSPKHQHFASLTIFQFDIQWLLLLSKLASVSPLHRRFHRANAFCTRLHPKSRQWDRLRPFQWFVYFSLTYDVLSHHSILLLGSSVEGKDMLSHDEPRSNCGLIAGTTVQGHAKRELSDGWVPAQLWVISQAGTNLYTIENTNSRTYLDLGMLFPTHTHEYLLMKLYSCQSQRDSPPGPWGHWLRPPKMGDFSQRQRHCLRVRHDSVAIQKSHY
jgi:hypothetical protein